LTVILGSIFILQCIVCKRAAWTLNKVHSFVLHRQKKGNMSLERHEGE